MNQKNSRNGLSAALLALAALAVWVPDGEAVSIAYADVSLSFTVSSSDGTPGYSQPSGFSMATAQIDAFSGMNADAGNGVPVSGTAWLAGPSWSAANTGPMAAAAAAAASTASGGSVLMTGYTSGQTDIQVSGGTLGAFDLIINPAVFANVNLTTDAGDTTSGSFWWQMNLYDVSNPSWTLLGTHLSSFGYGHPGLPAPDSYSQGFTDSTPFTFSGVAIGTPLRLFWYAGVQASASTPTPVPDGSGTLTLLSGVLLGFAGVRRRLAAYL